MMRRTDGLMAACSIAAFLLLAHSAAAVTFDKRHEEFLGQMDGSVTVTRRAMQEVPSTRNSSNACTWANTSDSEYYWTGGFCIPNLPEMDPFVRASPVSLARNAYASSWYKCYAHTITMPAGLAWHNQPGWRANVTALNQTEVSACINDTENACAVYYTNAGKYFLCSVDSSQPRELLAANATCPGSKREALFKCLVKSRDECEMDAECFDFEGRYFQQDPANADQVEFGTLMIGNSSLLSYRGSCLHKSMLDGLPEGANITETIGHVYEAYEIVALCPTCSGLKPVNRTALLENWGNCTQAMSMALSLSTFNTECDALNPLVLANATTPDGGLALNAVGVADCLQTGFCHLLTTRNMSAPGTPITSAKCSPDFSMYLSFFYSAPEDEWVLDAIDQCAAYASRYDRELCLSHRVTPPDF